VIRVVLTVVTLKLNCANEDLLWKYWIAKG